MAVTLEWVRDNYDANKNRYIEAGERDTAEVDWNAGKITMEQFVAVMNACSGQALLPEYGLPPSAITCNDSTPHFSSGCDLLKRYDVNNDGIIGTTASALYERNAGIITSEEYDFVVMAYNAGSINALCTGCSTGAPPLAITCSGATPHYSSGCALLQHYDYGNDGVLSMSDFGAAMSDKNNGVITSDEFLFVESAYNAGSINAVCSGCVSTPITITCNGATQHYSSGCALLLHYDTTDDGTISISELTTAIGDRDRGAITNDEFSFVEAAWNAGSINGLCYGCHTGTTPTPVCTPGDERCKNDSTIERCKTDGSGWYDVFTCGTGYKCENGECVPTSTPTPPPGMETRTVSLTEGTHTIQVSLNGYDTLNATINVTSTGVTCVSVIGGACGGTGLPRVSTSGLTVSTYLKTVTTTSSYATWLAGKGGLTNVTLSDIFELKDAFIGLTNVGFAPTLQQIMECKDAFIGL